MKGATHKILRPLVLLTLLAVSGCSSSSESSDADKESLRKARLLIARGDVTEAESAARSIAAAKPDLADAWLVAAECAVKRGAYLDAVEDLRRIKANGSKAWLAARLLTADILHYELHQFRHAENAYQDVLLNVPENVTANDGYARLLGLCGRRSEAIPCVLRLIRAGHDTDLLMLLSRESGLLNNPEMLTAAAVADPDDFNPLLGQAAVAAASQQPKLALEKLEAAQKIGDLPPEFTGWVGRQLLNSGQVQRLESWCAELGIARLDAVSWLVLAELSESAGENEVAVRCAWEASRRRPESLSAIHLLARSLTAIGKSDLAIPLFERVHQLNDLRDIQHQALMADGAPDERQFLQMLTALQSVGRLWETLAWARVGLARTPQNIDIQRLVAEIQEREPLLMLQLTAEEFNLAAKLDLSEFPAPSTARLFQQRTDSLKSKNITFEMQAAEIGFQFEYFPGAADTTHRMLEFGGGGLAAVDFDNDGYADLFCSQGCEIPHNPAVASVYHDIIFRNLRGERFRDVSKPTGFEDEADFNTGVSVGDINNDGFADVYVAAIGMNRLWLNNGDGTFSVAPVNFTDDQSEWTTSCLIADLDGDTVPDIYDVNYLAGSDLFTRLCEASDKQPAMCTPYDFLGAVDRIRIGEGDGRFQDCTPHFLVPAPTGKGLGIAAFRAGSGGLSVFVANDTVANSFYTSDSLTPASLSDNGTIAGLAFNAAGSAEACMGVAIADCNQDGQIDLFVTNFQYESNTLYAQVAPGIFEDQTRKLGLQEVSLPLLGFGTQFLDANLDTRQELFVANGHTSDLTRLGNVFQMPPQVFEWTGTRFESLNSDIIGDWSRQKFVGRAVARIDWNRDGRADLAVGVLRDPSFLLTNISGTADNHFLTLQITSTDSSRDALGTIVKIKTSETVQTIQLTGGDGYQCTNQRQLHVGCGLDAVIDEVEVTWPSGRIQTFNNVPSDTHVGIVEGRQLAVLPH